MLRDRNANIWNGVTSTFVAYATSAYSGYPITCAEQGVASAYYVGSIPASVPAGIYSALFKQQIGVNPAESDTTIVAGDINWNGSNVAPLSDTATSGQLGTLSPIRLARGTMVKNYPLYLKSAADHVTPLVSGTVSGQISRDGASFGALQSGSFAEVGLGWYSLQALTSGDLLANTVALLFTAANPSGQASDPLPQAFVLQRTSGQ